MNESLEARIRRARSERIDIVPYDPGWPRTYALEARHLRELVGPHIKRIEHFGGTAVPGLASKPIIDILVGVKSSAIARDCLAPLLEQAGYEYFWRTDLEEPYAWFIKRGGTGRRSHHIHVIEDESPMWVRLLFRDFLREHPEEAGQYGRLKSEQAQKFPNDREAYTRAKTQFVLAITARARACYGAG